MARVFEGIGAVIAIIGAAGMDSEQLIYPIAMMAAGAAIVWIASRFDDAMED